MVGRGITTQEVECVPMLIQRGGERARRGEDGLADETNGEMAEDGDER